MWNDSTSKENEDAAEPKPKTKQRTTKNTEVEAQLKDSTPGS